MENVSDRTASFIYCFKHQHKLAKKYCETCDQFICNSCTIDEHFSHLNSVHKLNSIYVNKTGILQKFLSFNNDKVKSSNFFKCMNFVFHEARYYCKQCANFICAKCLTTHESEHASVPIENYLPMLREKIKFFINIIESGYDFKFCKLKTTGEEKLIQKLIEDELVLKVFELKSKIRESFDVFDNINYNLFTRIYSLVKEKGNVLANSKEKFTQMQKVFDLMKFEKDFVKTYDYLIQFENLIDSIIPAAEMEEILKIHSEYQNFIDYINSQVEQLKQLIKINFIDEYFLFHEKFDNLINIFNDNLKDGCRKLLNLSEEKYEKLKTKKKIESYFEIDRFDEIENLVIMKNEERQVEKVSELQKESIITLTLIGEQKNIYTEFQIEPSIDIEIPSKKLEINYEQELLELQLKYDKLQEEMRILKIFKESFIPNNKQLFDNITVSINSKEINTIENSMSHCLDQNSNIITQNQQNEKDSNEFLCHQDEKKNLMSENLKEKNEDDSSPNDENPKNFANNQENKTDESKIIEVKSEEENSREKNQTFSGNLSNKINIETITKIESQSDSKSTQILVENQENLPSNSQTTALDNNEKNQLPYPDNSTLKKKIDLINLKISQLINKNDKDTFIEIITEGKEVKVKSHNNYIEEYLTILSWEERNMTEIISVGYNCHSCFVFNPFLNTIKEIQFGHFKFPAFHSFINLLPWVFVSGGKDIHNKELDSFFKFRRTDHKNFEYFQLSPMKEKRIYHTMLEYKNKIYALSGSKLKSCEKYDISNDSWVSLPNLNSTRERASAAIHNEEFLYIFLGFDRVINKFVNTIEKMSLIKEESWETVNLKGNTNLLKKQSSCIYSNAQGVYLLGGVNAFRNESKDVLFFEYTKNFISAAKINLLSNASFNQIIMQKICEENILYNFTENFEISRFDEKEMKFI